MFLRTVPSFLPSGCADIYPRIARQDPDRSLRTSITEELGDDWMLKDGQFPPFLSSSLHVLFFFPSFRPSVLPSFLPFFLPFVL
jgi:hypothetical protein